MQGTIEDGVARVLQLSAPPRLTVAGRTDAGVHALGQVAHVDLPTAAANGLARRLDGVLPVDIRVHSAEPAPVGFDARFSALSRTYSYRVADPQTPANPLRRWDTVTHPRPLRLAALRAASAGLLGERDFAAYCRPRRGATTVRRLLELDWRRDDDGVLVARMTADAFCHSMVRSLVGALLLVGDGRRSPDWPGQVLVGGVRDSSVPVAPAHGLTLLAVRYPAEEELASRAAGTRKRRDPASVHTGH